MGVFEGLGKMLWYFPITKKSTYSAPLKGLWYQSIRHGKFVRNQNEKKKQGKPS